MSSPPHATKLRGMSATSNEEGLMQLGMIGLGRMGGNIVRRLIKIGNHRAVVYDRDAKAVSALAEDGAAGADSLAKFVSQLEKPRTVWIMLPSGKITEDTINELSGLLEPDDVLIDGGNTFWQDDIRRAKALKDKRIHYLDVGTSGGVWGLDRGYCMMIGGDKAVVDRLDPIFATLAPGAGDIPRTPSRDGRDPRVEQGYIHAGPAGAGHFVKMIHNGIEYGLMQAYAEGFDILKNANLDSLPQDHQFTFNIADIAEVWRRGSVIPSWLLDLTATALARDAKLDAYSGFVEDSGEGRWTINAAIDEAVPAEVLTAALFARFRSRQEHTYAEKILSAMRAGFGGHREPSPAGHTPAKTER
jgi:6-phosphogluconate dehydrogenase